MSQAATSRASNVKFCHYCGAVGAHGTNWGDMCDACHKKINELQKRKGYAGAGIG